MYQGGLHFCRGGLQHIAHCLVHFLKEKVRRIVSVKVTGVEAPERSLLPPALPMSVKSAKLLSPKLKLRECLLVGVGVLLFTMSS